MFIRKAQRQLEAWKQDATDTALLVNGARNVGKTTLVRNFASSQYESCVELNFRTNAEACAALMAATNVEDLLQAIAQNIETPMQAGKTLIFFDEAQECPNILPLVRMLLDDHRYDIVLASERFDAGQIASWSEAEGYLTLLSVYPLDFEEFCLAGGVSEEEFAIARQSYAKKAPVPDSLHQRLTDLFHRYILVGGIPYVAAAYLGTNSVDQARKAQSEVTASYIHDISRYGPKEQKAMIKSIYELVPAEMTNQNGEYRFGILKGVNEYSQVQDELQWLLLTHMALQANMAKALDPPLLEASQADQFKLAYNDVGLLARVYPKQTLLGLLDGKPTRNLYGFYANFVIQELTAHGLKPYYHLDEAAGEVDFVLEQGQRLLACLLRTNAADKPDEALLSTLMEKPGLFVETLVFTESNVVVEGDVTYLPVYMAAMLEDGYEWGFSLSDTEAS
ncbi:MAG: AAA family ATPase [Coriobacteriia bacterium]|nr:AAA family ATPase [Coriobacteriia bacterium]